MPRKTHYASQHCFQLTAVGGDSGSTVASYCLWNRGLCARCAPERGACHPAWANEAEGMIPPPLAGVSVDPFEPDRGCAQQCMQPRVSKLASVFVWSRSETLFSLRNVAWYSGLDRAVWVFSGSAVAASGTHAFLQETISELVGTRDSADPLKAPNLELPTVDQGTNMYALSNQRLFCL